ncbi:MAG: hypothetical protein E7643_05665 [Ruminococcaceae bacterium]|nr:hypothetical protein [Oscillospiraceae bacterium]
MKKTLKRMLCLFVALALLGGIALTACTKNKSDEKTVMVGVTNLKQTSSAFDIGIDAKNVRLSWELFGDVRGIYQSAYYLTVRTETATVYDSGWVASSSQTGIPVENLAPETVYYWSVNVRDQHGNESGFSDEASFETAPEAVEGEWIGLAALLRCEFTLEQPLENVARARSYFGAPSPIEVRLNGQKAGELVLAPMKSVADLEVYYNTYDVASLLKEGKNVLGIMCSNFWNFPMGQRAAGMLRIYYRDGSVQTVKTDESWKMTKDSMILRSDWYRGEDIDGNEMIGWDTVDYDSKHWEKAEEITSRIRNGKFYMSPGDNILTSNPVVSGDYTIEAGVEITNGAYASIVFGRANKNPHMWQFDGERGTLRIHPSGGWSGSEIKIVDCPGIRKNGLFHVKIELVGTTVNTYVEGVFVNGFTVSEDSKEGSVGFRTATNEGMAVEYLKVTQGDAIVFEDDFDTVDRTLWSVCEVGALRPALTGSRICAEIAPVRVWEVGEPLGRYKRFILDFGVNVAGFVRVSGKLEKDDRVTLAYSELIDENGELFANTTCHYPTCTYYFTGEEDSFEPHFFYNGFRYVEVLAPVMSAEMFTACVVSNAMEETASFKSSSDRLNGVFDLYYRAQLSNMVNVYTDCPQREKQGWTGDAFVTKNSAGILFEDYTMAEAYMRMMTQNVMESGMPNVILPQLSTDESRAMYFDIPWATAYFVFPYQTYMQTGDPYYIEMMYDTALEVFEYYKSIAGRDGIPTKVIWGDWMGYDNHRNMVNKDALGAVFAYHSGMLVSKMAQIIGREHTALDAELEVLYEAIRERFYAERYFGSNTQANNATALEFGLIAPEERDAFVEILRSNIEKYGYLRTGVLGTYSLYNVLSAQNEHKLLMDLTLNEEKCSFGYMLDNGATSMWEFWDKVGETWDSEKKNCTYDSQNHCMLGGSMASWLFEGVAGVRATGAGYSEITYRPGIESGLSWAQCEIDTVRGIAASHWSYEDGVLNWKVTVPANSDATIIIPIENARSITESGIDVKEKNGEGLTYIGIEDGAHIWHAGSGIYTFRATEN